MIIISNIKKKEENFPTEKKRKKNSTQCNLFSTPCPFTFLVILSEPYIKITDY